MIFQKRGGGSTAVLNFSKKSSILVGWPFPYYDHHHDAFYDHHEYDYADCDHQHYADYGTYEANLDLHYDAEDAYCDHP